MHKQTQTDGWMDGWMDGWTDGWMDGSIDRQIDRNAHLKTAMDYWVFNIKKRV